MKLAIMQPYFFPYIGYFQLINAVDKFIFYDDVNFINRGWINRNKILINGKENYLTINLKEASQNKLINEILIIDNRLKVKKTLYMAYKKAPYFSSCWPLVEDCMNYKIDKISELTIYSIRKVSEYLALETLFDVSSKSYTETKNLKKEDRLLEICKKNNADIYINAIGGVELYNKKIFKNKGIDLYFLMTKEIRYKQFNNDFVPNLSIIDVMMFNSIERIKYMLDDFELI